MTISSIEIQNNLKNAEFTNRLENLGDFGYIVKLEFLKKHQKPLDGFLNQDLTNTQKEILGSFIDSLEPRLLNLKEKSEKHNLTIEDIQTLLNAENRSYIPESVKNNLQAKLEELFQDALSQMDKNFIDKSKIQDFLNNYKFSFDKIAFLRDYIGFINGLKSEGKYLHDVIEDINSDSIQYLSLHTVQEIGKFANLGSYNGNNIFPKETLAAYNQIAYKYSQSGVLDPMRISGYIVSEEGIRGLGKKALIIEDEAKNTQANQQVNLSMSQNAELIGIEKLADLYENNKGILLEMQKGNFNLEQKAFLTFQAEYNILLKTIQEKYNFVPFQYLNLKQNIDNFGEQLILQDQHKRTMLQFLDMCEEWMKYNDSKGILGFLDKADIFDYTPEDYNAIEKAKKQILEGKINSFKDLDNDWDSIVNDSKIADILQEYWNYLKDTVLNESNDEKVKDIAKKTGVENDWDFDLWHINMKDLNKVLQSSYENPQAGWNLDTIKFAQAIEMVDLNSDYKSETLEFIQGQVLDNYLKHKGGFNSLGEEQKQQITQKLAFIRKQLETNNLSTQDIDVILQQQRIHLTNETYLSTLEPSKESVDAEAKKLDKQINRNQYSPALKEFSLVQKIMILGNGYFTSHGIDVRNVSNVEMDQINDAVLDKIKPQALENIARKMLFQKALGEATRDGNNLDGLAREYMQKHNSEWNDFFSSALNISEMVITEAVIFVGTSILTAGMGTLAAGANLGLSASRAVGRIGTAGLETTDKLQWIYRGVHYTNLGAQSLGRAGVNTFKYAQFAGHESAFGRMSHGLYSTAKAGGRLSVEAGLYTAGSDIMYDGDQWTLDNYITNLTLFAGGVLGMNVGGKFVERSSSEFKKYLAQAIGGTLGGTGAMFITEDFKDGLSLEQAGTMMTQGLFLGGLMMPLMRHKGVQNIGEKGAQKILDTKVVQEWNNSTLKKARNSTTASQQFLGGKKAQINQANQQSLTETGKKVNSLNDSIDTRIHSDSTATRIIYENVTNNTVGKIVRQKGIQAIDGIKRLPNHLESGLTGYLLKNQSAKLETIKRIDQTAKYSDLGNGFSLKNGTEIINRDFQTVANLPKGMQIEGIQYLTFGNTRIPTLHLSDGKILRLSRETNIGNPGTYQKLMGELQTHPGRIDGIFNQKNELVGYKKINNQGNESYIQLDGASANNTTIKLWKNQSQSKRLDTFSERTLASNGKFTADEIMEAGLRGKKGQEIKNKFDKAFKEAFPDDATFKKSILERFERIKKDPNATPEQKKEAGRIMGLLEKGWNGIKSIGNITKKTLFYSALAGGGILGIDYLPDSEIDLVDVEGLGMALGTLVLTSDAGITLLGKLGGENGKKVAESIVKTKSNNKTISKILQIGSALVAYNIGSSEK